MEMKNYDIEPVDSILVKSRDEVATLISNQITAADTILKMEVQGQKNVDYGPFGGKGIYWAYDEEQKEAFYNAYHAWDTYNVELLTRVFKHPCNRCRSDYETIGSVGIYSGHENLVEKSRKGIREKVAYLKGLISRLPLIPVMEDDEPKKGEETFVLQKTPKIFISHKTEDTNYAKAIVDMLITLGVKHADIFCSSVDGYGIPFGKNIIDTLHNQFDSYELFVIFVHSPRYYNSAVSLNEMGAAWILRSEHRSFLTKNCEFSMLTGVIDSHEIAFKAGQENTEHLLYDFRRDIQNFFSLDEIPDAIWEATKKEFIEKVKSFEYENTEANNITPLKTKLVEKKCKHGSYEDIVVDYIKQAGKEVSISDISSNTGLSMSTTSRILRILRNKEIIMIDGHAKNRKFKLN